jgi:Uma2 family endonuclease
MVLADTDHAAASCAALLAVLSAGSLVGLPVGSSRSARRKATNWSHTCAGLILPIADCQGCSERHDYNLIKRKEIRRNPMTTVLKDHFVSIEDYFALDSENARERWEWRNGDVYCMSGAQPEHNLCCTNLVGELRSRLRGSSCRTYTSDQRVKVHAGSPYLYPDVSVACDSNFTTINGLRTLLNPVLIVEILSPSTAQDDKGTKFMQYQTIESLTDYLLVDSSECAVLHYRKEPEVWTPRLYEQASDEVELPGLGIALPLAEIYLDTGLLPV